MFTQGIKTWEKGRWTLRCTGIFAETRDVKTFHFVDAEEGTAQTLFRHKPGQFITLRLQSGGKAVTRSYTVASPPTRPDTLQLTIKRDPDGLVSRFMHDHLRVGDVLPAMGPAGVFTSADIDTQSRLLLLSGGSGITPVMSVLRHIFDTADNQTDVVFLHSARTPQDIIFRDELAWMAAQRDNIDVGFICETGAEAGMRAGFLTLDMLMARVHDYHNRTIMTCGPAPYMAAVKDMLLLSGYDMDHYHEESFGDPTARQNPDGAVPQSIGPVETADTTEEALPADPLLPEPAETLPATKTADGPNVVTFAASGQEVAYSDGETVLAIATRAGIAIPTNCQMGLCGTCMLKVISGEVEMEEDEGLEEEFRAKGYRLTCCGYPKSALTVDY